MQIFGGCSQPLVHSLISLLDGDISGCKDLVPLLVPGTKAESVERMITYMDEAKSVLNLDFKQKISLPTNVRRSTFEDKAKAEAWALMLRKVQEGTASSKDLFQLLDQQGNKNGTISEKSSKILLIDLE